MITIPIADLHTHYPMHLRSPDVNDGPVGTLPAIVRDVILDRARGSILKLARRFFSDETPFSGPQISIPRYRHGGVEVAFSALYSPFDELFARGRAFGPPVSDDFDTILDQMRIVEESLAVPGTRARLARSMREIEDARRQNLVAMLHCVEGGFQVGATKAEIDANVATLRARGVAYVTVAHLFFRGIASNAAALPFLPDRCYHRLFKEPDVGLTDLGKALVEAMHTHGILVDVTHMSARALDETFAVLDALDRRAGRTTPTPVIASHGACRFGDLEYNLEDRHIAAIARRGGVIGIITCEHYAKEGLVRSKPTTFEESFEVMARHAERIRDVSGGTFENVGIGSDHDGFIKPTLVGLEHPGMLQRLVHGFADRFGEADARRIGAENALRVLAQVFPA